MPVQFHSFFSLKIIIHLIGIVFLLGCKVEFDGLNTKEHLTEIPSHFGNAGIIRFPISSDGLIDTNQLGKIKFEEYSFDFGKVKSGTKVIHTYDFKNIGGTSLIISNANANCGCTVPYFPKEPILPGENGTIKVIFDTQGRFGFQTKKINVFANTYPSQNILELTGQIID